MRQVTLHITNNKYPLFMEIAKSLDFVKKIEDEIQPTKEQILKGLKEAVKEVNQIKTGKLKGTSARDLLNEL